MLSGFEFSAYGEPILVDSISVCQWLIHMHRDKLHEIAILNGKLTMAGVHKLDSKKPAEFYVCEEAFAMLEYLSFNAPKIMDSLLTMQINSLEGQLAVAQSKAEKVMVATL